MRLAVHLHGDDILIRKLNPPRLIGQPSHALMRRFGEIARENIRDEAPSFSNDLRDSIDFQKEGAAISEWVRVSSSLDYAPSVNDGSRPHMPPVDAITPWALAHGIPPWALAKRIAQVGTRPNPFFRRGFERSAKQLGHLLTLMARDIERSFASG